MIQPDPLFVDEALANLDAMERALCTAGDGDMAPDDVHAVFRWAHSVKGGAAAFGLTGLSELMHQAESLLDQWRKSRLPANARSRALLRDAVATARICVASGSRDVPGVAELVARLKAASGAAVPVANARMLRLCIAQPHRSDLDAAVSGLFRDIDGIGRIVATSIGTAGERVFDLLSGVAEQELIDLLAMQVDRTSITIHPLPSFEAGAQAQERWPASPTSGTMASASVRVTLEELRTLGLVTKQLVRASAELAGVGITDSPPSHSFARERSVAQVCELAGRLEQLVQQMRTAPMSVLFALLQPALDTLSVQLDKSFALTVSGEALRLDRTAMQALADPLIQLIRNSCDHGVESRALRIAAGKPVHGHISVTAAFRDEFFELTVHDDGRGLSRSQLLHAALARGLDVSDAQPDSALWQLVFLPGFSTVGQATPVSGRGVGMDLVQQRLHALGGSVSIESEASRGMKVTLVLPGDIAMGGGDSA